VHAQRAPPRPDDCLRARQGLEKDPSKIPVKAIIKEWRNQSKLGRYEGAVWRASALDPPTMNGELDDEQLDRLAAHPDW